MTLEQRDRKRAQDRAYGRAHRAERRAYHKAYRLANGDRLRATDRAYGAAHKAEACARATAWAIAHPERTRARTDAWALAHPERRRAIARAYVTKYPERMNVRTAKRRAQKLQATPSWANHAAISAVYAEASRLTRETGTVHHVDHIYPLCSRLVSGLHVEGNLQILTRRENHQKGNKYPLSAA